MSNLESIKQEYLKQLKLSRMELDTLDKNTRYSVEGVVNSAKQKLPELKSKLLLMVLTDSTTVYVPSGVNIDEALKEVIESNTNVAELDFLDLEKRLLKEVYPQDKIKGYAFNGAAISRLNNSLVDIRTVISASFIPPITASAADYKVLNNEAEALAHLQSVLQRAYGTQLKSLYLAKQMNDFTISRMETDTKMFFFVKNADNVSAMEKITGRTIVLDDVTEPITDAKELQAAVGGKVRGRSRKNTLTQNEQE